MLTALVELYWRHLSAILGGCSSDCRVLQGTTTELNCDLGNLGTASVLHANHPLTTILGENWLCRERHLLCTPVLSDDCCQLIVCMRNRRSTQVTSGDLVYPVVCVYDWLTEEQMGRPLDGWAGLLYSGSKQPRSSSHACTGTRPVALYLHGAQTI